MEANGGDGPGKLVAGLGLAIYRAGNLQMGLQRDNVPAGEEKKVYSSMNKP